MSGGSTGLCRKTWVSTADLAGCTGICYAFVLLPQLEDSGNKQHVLCMRHHCITFLLEL